MVSSGAVPAARMFLTTTLAVVMFTVFAQVMQGGEHNPANISRLPLVVSLCGHLPGVLESYNLVALFTSILCKLYFSPTPSLGRHYQVHSGLPPHRPQ